LDLPKAIGYVHGQSDVVHVVDHVAADGLVNPPGYISGDFCLEGVIEILDSFDEPYVAFVDEVHEQGAVRDVTPGNFYDQPQVAGDQCFACLLIPFVFPLGELNFFVSG